MSEAAASLCRCSSRASRAASRPGACAAPPRAARRRSSAGVLAVIAAGAGATALAGLLALVMAALVVDARRWVRLAARSRVGARSEARFDERSAGWRRRGGGCGTRSRVAGAGISTASRSPRPGSRSRSSPRRARSTHATWPTPGRRPRGFTGIAGAGAVEERSRCCAWCARAGSRTSRTRFSWCRLTAWRRRSEPAREPHPGPGSWPRSPRPAERERSGGC